MKTLLILLCIIASQKLYSANPPLDPDAVKKYYILVPTGDSRNNLPLLTYLPVTDPRYADAIYLFEKTFIAKSTMLYRMLQQYLVNKGERNKIEPAYLLLSHRQGGFPMQGFYLQEGDSIIDNYKTYYIDLPDIDKDPATLNSLTQIFPHEMAHVFFILLAPKINDNYKAFSSDIHYFSVMTNYQTAFSEGFAEHFENASRLYEPDKKIRDGVQAHTDRIERKITPKLKGVDHDFRYPFRLEFYRATMLFWYQRFEDYKRYIWATEEDFSKTNTSMGSDNAEKAIQYRNIGLGLKGDTKRNMAQVASSEGVINAFFTRFLQSGAKNNYESASFYYPFLTPGDSAGFNSLSLDPVTNHYLKIFTVMNRQMNHEAGDTSFLQIFINGYIRQFPVERKIIEMTFREVTGMDYTPLPVKELWIQKDDHHHRYLLLDQFGGTRTDFYSFNLNTADRNDLSVFDGLSKKDISEILYWRDKNKAFGTIEELHEVSGLSQQSISEFVSAAKEVSNTRDDKKIAEINIVNILISNIGRVFLNGIIWFAVFIILFYFAFRYKKHPVKSILLFTLQKFFKFYILIIAGMILVIFSGSPRLVFTAIVAGMLIIDIIKTRKNASRRPEVIVTTIVMGVIVFYSLI